MPDFLRKNDLSYEEPGQLWTVFWLAGLADFFLHNGSHNHVTHHYFPMIPFYNQPQVMQAIKPILGQSYVYDPTDTFYALYRSFNECQFIEDEDAIAFYKNEAGVAQRDLADGVSRG